MSKVRGHGTGPEGSTMLKAERRSVNPSSQLHRRAHWCAVISSRICGKEFVSNKDLCIRIVKKGINTARLDCDLLQSL